MHRTGKTHHDDDDDVMVLLLATASPIYIRMPPIFPVNVVFQMILFECGSVGLQLYRLFTLVLVY